MRITFLIYLWINLFLSLELFSENTEDKSDSKENTITVTATRRKGLLKDATITTEVINRKDIDAMGAKDISETLGNIPGIEVRPAQSGERGSTVRLQGLAAQNVLILVDGQRTTGRFSGSIDLTRFKVDDIERIEIVKGASSAIYGSDAIAGVINIITKESKSPFSAEFRSLAGTGSKLYYGPYLEYRNSASLGIRRESVGTYFTVGWHRGEGYDLTRDATEGPRNGRIASLSPTYNPYINGTSFVSSYLYSTRLPSYTPPLESTSGGAFNDLNVSNKSTWQVSQNLLLTSTVYYRYLQQMAVDASLPKTIYDRSNQTHDFMAALNADWNLNQKLSLHTNVNHSKFLDLFRNDQRKSDELDTQQRTNNSVSEVRNRFDYQFSESHVTSVGLEYLYDSISSARIAPDCKREFPNLCAEDFVPDISKSQSINGNAFRFRTAFFIQDEWKISDKPRVQVVPGIRYDRDSIYGGQWLPKLALRYDITDRLRLRLANGLGYRAPSFQDLYFNFLNPGVGYRVAGNPNLQPELSRSYNLGLEWDLTKNIWLSSNLFHNNVDNLIGFRTNPLRDRSGLLVYQTSNYQKAMTAGIESSIQFRLTEAVNVGVGYTYTHTKDELTNLPLEGRGPHRWNMNIRYEDKSSGLSLSAFAIHFGKQAFYCVKNPFWCDPVLSNDLSAISSYLTQISQTFITSSLQSIPNAVSEECAKKNESFCTTESTYGYRMVNPYTNLNLRISKRFLGHFEWFLGVDNALDQWDLTYNPQKPRFFYFGLDGRI
ncbi:putative TonB-dependent outer membrane receptor [Leptospira ryugenii]|uniref:Putative TonB-dependent outer membrane receptor n=1 Tax=Leptospira ryugenii TaxID=1917863 RepID=A0A2P2E2A3_9LEPT|nr:TonB-dependent receptor [Leptospira ryugenii]GBF51027.1 putative TonB-dependent outer membrane receptor [Leptospira ryugenii]